MRVRRTVPLLATVAVVAALAPPSAGAAAYRTPKARGDITRTPLIKVVDGGRSVALTDAATRRYRRGSLTVTCGDVPDELGSRTTGSPTVGAALRPNPRLRIPRGKDFCVATLRTTRGRTTDIRSAGTIAITEAGDDYLYERAIAGVMALTSTLTFRGPEDRPEPVAEIIATLRGVRVSGRAVTGVATPGPRTPVPVDRIGIWTDGTRTSITATTPAGRRLYFDYDRATRETASNVLAALNDSFGAETATLR